MQTQGFAKRLTLVRSGMEGARGIIPLAIFLFILGAALAQNSQIEGVILDQSTGVIPGAEVIVTSTATGVSRTVVSNDVGAYAVPLLRDGEYTVRASMTGFATQEATVRLEVGQVARLDFELAIGQIDEVVEVEADATEVVNYKAADVGQVIDEKRIRELPLNGRNYLELAQLSSGIVRSSQGGRGHRTAAAGGFRASGQDVAQNTLLLDGADITSKTSRGPLGFEAQAVQPNVEALSEFKVLTNNTSAEYGYRTGATVLVNTKGGTNQFHGSAFWFHRNSAQAANNFFSNRAGQDRPQYIRNQYGATLGGPVIRDRTFFFASFQGTRIRRGASASATVPSAAARQGDFSQEPGGLGRSIDIYDPLTLDGSGAGAERQQFPNNVIPVERMDPIAQSILALYPQPNVPGRENLPSNYFSSPGEQADVDQYDFRVDHNFDDANRIFVSYSLRDELQNRPGALSEATGLGGDVTDLLGQNIRANWASSLGATVFNEFRFAYTDFDTAFDIPEKENLNAQYGIKNAVGTAFGQHDFGLAQFSPTGFATVGSYCCWPNDDVLKTYQVSDNFLWQAGSHSLKFGGEYKHLNKLSISARNNRGSFAFNGQYTAQFPNDGASRASTGHSLADFLLGWGSGGDSAGPAGENTDHPYWAFYAQDDWKLTPRLTINLGLRWELFRGPFHPDGPNSIGAQLVFQGDPDLKALDDDYIPVLDVEFQEWRFPANAHDCACRPDKNNFGPRIGLAYQITQNTVLRAGAGVYYGDVDYLGIEDGRFYGNNPPRVRGVTLIADREQPVLTLQGGLPDLSPEFPLDEIPPGTPFTVVVPEFLNTKSSAQWFMDVQRRIPWDVILTLGYNGSATSHLSVGRLVTDPGPHPTINWPARTRSPFAPNLPFFTKYDNILNANYNALNFKAEKRFSDGLTFLSSFTWQHSIDYGNELLGQGLESTLVTQRISDLWRARGRSGLDRKLAYNASFMYELPGPRSGTAGMVLGGWQVGGILSLLSGPYFTHNLTNNLNAIATARGDQVAEPNLPESERTVDHWFNTDFAVGVTPDDIAAGRYGNAGRSLIEAPGWKSFDMLISKNFYMPWREGEYLQFRAEAFNLTNTPHFGRPVANLDSAAAGQISSAEDPRLIQFALRYVF